MSSSGCPSGFDWNNRHCFRKGTEKKTFEEAKTACEQRGGFLAEPRSEAIVYVITQFFDFHAPFFIGLQDTAHDGVFRWQTDNAALSFDDWDEGQPDNGGHCVQVNTNYYWGDCSCTEKLNYLCMANKGKFYPLVLEFIRNTNRHTFEEVYLIV